MPKRINKPELCVHRAFTNERPMLDLFADAYRVYFDEKIRVKSSYGTFDHSGARKYNGDTRETKGGNDDGTAA